MKREGFSVSSMKWLDLTLLPLIVDTMLYMANPKSLSNGLVRIFIPHALNRGAAYCIRKCKCESVC